MEGRRAVIDVDHYSTALQVCACICLRPKTPVHFSWSPVCTFIMLCAVMSWHLSFWMLQQDVHVSHQTGGLYACEILRSGPDSVCTWGHARL